MLVSCRRVNIIINISSIAYEYSYSVYTVGCSLYVYDVQCHDYVTINNTGLHLLEQGEEALCDNTAL